MKIVLDIDKLLESGEITRDQYERLKKHSLLQTGALAFNILVAFGVFATASGMLALAPSTTTATILGAVITFAGIVLKDKWSDEWRVLGTLLLILGALTVGGTILAAHEDNLMIGFLIQIAWFGITAILAKSALLTVMATIALSFMLGSMTEYQHATYTLIVRQPTLTVFAFSILALATYQLSKHLRPDHERLAITCSRASLLWVNLGFWVGSLWGDSLWMYEDYWTQGNEKPVPDWLFAVVWAIALIITLVWGARKNKRWVVNLTAIFGAIHLYSQYFEHFGASPIIILVGGLAAIGFAYGIAAYNRKSKTTAQKLTQTGETV